MGQARQPILYPAILVAPDGNDPSFPAYETGVLPLNYGALVDSERIELSFFGCRPNVLPLTLTARWFWNQGSDLNSKLQGLAIYRLIYSRMVQRRRIELLSWA